MVEGGRQDKGGLCCLLCLPPVSKTLLPKEGPYLEAKCIPGVKVGLVAGGGTAGKLAVSSASLSHVLRSASGVDKQRPPPAPALLLAWARASSMTSPGRRELGWDKTLWNSSLLKGILIFPSHDNDICSL